MSSDGICAVLIGFFSFSKSVLPLFCCCVARLHRSGEYLASGAVLTRRKPRCGKERSFNFLCTHGDGLRSLLPDTDKPSPLRRTSLWVCPAQRTWIHGSMGARAASDKRLLTGRFELGRFALQFARVENLRRAVLGDFLQDPAIA